MSKQFSWDRSEWILDTVDPKASQWSAWITNTPCNRTLSLAIALSEKDSQCFKNKACGAMHRLVTASGNAACQYRSLVIISFALGKMTSIAFAHSGWFVSACTVFFYIRKRLLGKRLVNTFPIGCSRKTSVSAKAIFRFGPWAFTNDFDSDSRNSAPSSKASGGHTYYKIPIYLENKEIQMYLHSYMP